jgi:hypothetical protein
MGSFGHEMIAVSGKYCAFFACLSISIQDRPWYCKVLRNISLHMTIKKYMMPDYLLHYLSFNIEHV